MIRKINEIAEIIDGDRGKNYPKQNEFYESEYCLFLDTGNVTTNGFSFQCNHFITQEKCNLLRKGKLQRGDLVYTTRGTIGNVAYYSNSVNYEHIRINSGMVILRVVPELCDSRFLYQLLKHPYNRIYMKSFCTGSAQPQLPIKNLSKIEIDIPDIETQHRIADILSAYDKLIENNQKQIKLLEEAAQRLYKEWFVDLRFPGYEHTEIVDGVPVGWTIKTIEDVCDTIGGGTPSTRIESYYTGGDIKWVTPSDITKNNSLILLDSEKKITKAGLDNSSAKMLPPYTILMTSRASIGYFGICKNEVCTNQGFISCIPYKEEIRYYLLYNLKNRLDEIRSKATGSTFLELSKRTFRQFSIVIPSDIILQQFQTYMLPMIQKQEALVNSIAFLKTARDRLLPKLMSGEIKV